MAGRQAAIGPELPSYMEAAHTSALEAILSSTHLLPIFSMEESQRADHVHPCGNVTRGPFAGGAWLRATGSSSETHMGYFSKTLSHKLSHLSSQK